MLPCFGRATFPFCMNKTLCQIVGFVFLLSALLKAIDTAAFADLMSDYGVLWFGFGAPVVIFIETILAVLLICNIRPRWISLTASIFILIVSSVYLFGILCKGITTCGCFGPLTLLNSKQWITFLRNGILLALLLPSIINPQQGASLSMPIVVFMAIIGVVVMFMCGFSMHGARCLQKQQKTFTAIPLRDSKLSNLVFCSYDSTYMVFAFSYNCPFCQNSIGNVNQYQSMGYVDKVVGLAIEDSATRERFDRLFDINFTIKEVPHWTMAQLTNTLPTIYFIRHDSIINQYSGLVVSPALLLP